MSLVVWSWIFLVIYVGGMIGFGVIASRKIQGADDFATARKSYGPVFLALAFSATAASGATFLGLPGLTYEGGLPALWFLLYPAGIYSGVLISMRMISSAGNRW